MSNQNRKQENHELLVEYLAASGFADEQVKEFERRFGMLPAAASAPRGANAS